MPKTLDLVLVFVGGGMGASLRYLAGIALPYGTLFVNVVGCLLMGFLTYATIYKLGAVPEHYRLLVAVGVLGGFTTLSGLALELHESFLLDELAKGIGAVFLNILASLVAIFLGVRLAGIFFA